MALPRIVLEKAPTGLDVLFEEISRYASPENQLRIKESERADARLRLSQNQLDETVRQNSLTRLRQDEQDKLEQDKFGLQERQFELDSFKDAYNTTKAEIDSNVDFSYPDSQSLAKMEVEAVLAQVNTGNTEYDNKIKLRLKKKLQTRKDFGIRQESLAKDFMNRYNTRNPNLEYPMDMADARMFMKDDKSYQSYLYTNYVKDKNNITPDDAKALSYHTSRLASVETKRNKLYDKFALMPEDDEAYDTTKAQLDAYDKTISNFEAQASKIIAKGQGGQGGQGGELLDSFGTNLPADYTDPTELTMIKQQAPFIRDEDYELAFGTEDDTNQVILDNAEETAKKNISGENTEDVALVDDAPPVLTDDKIDKYNPTDESLDSASAVPPAFLQTAGDNIISGLGSAQAGDVNKIRDGADEELFPDTGQSLTSGNFLEVKSGSSRGKKFNVEVLTSKMANELKRIDSLKERYNKTAPSNKKTILARTLSGRQQEIKDILNPYLSSSGDFKNKEYNSKFYKMLSKKTNIPVNGLKQILMSNMEFNI